MVGGVESRYACCYARRARRCCQLRGREKSRRIERGEAERERIRRKKPGGLELLQSGKVVTVWMEMDTRREMRSRGESLLTAKHTKRPAKISQSKPIRYLLSPIIACVGACEHGQFRSAVVSFLLRRSQQHGLHPNTWPFESRQIIVF